MRQALAWALQVWAHLVLVPLALVSLPESVLVRRV